MDRKTPTMADIQVTRKRLEFLMSGCKHDLTLDTPSREHKDRIRTLMADLSLLQAAISKSEYTERAQRLKDQT